MKEYAHVKKIILVTRNEMLKFYGKNIETLTKYLNHLDIQKAIQRNPTHSNAYNAIQRIHLHGKF